MMTMLDEPLYMTTLTVGRKFSRAICQRAVCCRAEGFRSSDGMSKFKLNHPVLMETNVYMDETGKYCHLHSANFSVLILTLDSHLNTYSYQVLTAWKA